MEVIQTTLFQTLVSQFKDTILGFLPKGIILGLILILLSVVILDKYKATGSILLIAGIASIALSVL